jgi:hypothetical protein
MVRTQIYLTEVERKALKVLAHRLGKSQSEVIRGAVDGLIHRCSDGSRLDFLRSAYGMWKDRTDLPDFKQIRREMDRSEHGKS